MRGCVRRGCGLRRCTRAVALRKPPTPGAYCGRANWIWSIYLPSACWRGTPSSGLLPYPYPWPCLPLMRPTAFPSGGMTSARNTCSFRCWPSDFPPCPGWHSPLRPIPAPETRSALGCSWSRGGCFWPALIAPTSAICCAIRTTSAANCLSCSPTTAALQELCMPAPATGWMASAATCRRRDMTPLRITPDWMGRCAAPLWSASAAKAAWWWLPRSLLAWASTSRMCALWPTWTCPKAWRPTTRKPAAPVGMAYRPWPGWCMAAAMCPSCAASSTTPTRSSSKNGLSTASSMP